MYEFKDRLKTANVTSDLPSEALFINGISIDQEAQGYKTLYVEGRESLEKEFSDQKIKGIDGSFVYSKRRLSREITVGFELSGADPVEFESRYRELVKLIETEDEAMISFADEPNIHYLGHLKEIEAPEAHQCRQIIKMTFFCPDPYKYSNFEKEFPINEDNTITITNNGSVPVPIRYAISFTGDSGYLALTSGKGTLEYGYRDELDTEKVPRNQLMLKTETFATEVTKPTSLGPNNDKDHKYPHNMKSVVDGPNQEAWLAIDRVGAHEGTWVCGTLKRIAIGTDAEGRDYAPDWTLHWKTWFEESAAGECGNQEIAVYTRDDKLIARWKIWKTDTSGHNAHIGWDWQNGVFRKLDYVPFGKKGHYSQGKWGWNRITKKGDWVEFYMNNKYFRFHDSRLKDMNANKVQIALADHVGYNPVFMNRMTDIWFESIGVLTDVDKPNTFGTNTHLLIDGLVGKIYVNGEYRPELEIIGSQYFKADPGTTEVTVLPSSWFAGNLVGKAYIREAWL